MRCRTEKSRDRGTFTEFGLAGSAQRPSFGALRRRGAARGSALKSLMTTARLRLCKGQRWALAKNRPLLEGAVPRRRHCARNLGMLMSSSAHRQACVRPAAGGAGVLVLLAALCVSACGERHQLLVFAGTGPAPALAGPHSTLLPATKEIFKN